MKLLGQVMPALVRHEGEWDGSYRHIDATGVVVDLHQTWTRCELPEAGPHAYVQHNRLRWNDGRTAEYRFGGALVGDHLVWDTDRFHGYGWQTHEDVIMLRLDRRDVPGSYYIEMITIAPDNRTRARTWQWYREGVPWQRTLCDERRVG